MTFAAPDPLSLTLARLSQGEASVTELADPFKPMSLPAISKHLKVLEKAGLISQRREAQWRPCRLEPAPLKGVDDWLERYRRFYEASFDSLDDYLRQIQKPEQWPHDRGQPGGITITRVFDAPRELVFKAWTEPQRFAQWFGGREATILLDTVSMDIRPGGAWRATMFAGPDRTEIPWRGIYLEVAPPERLVFTLSDQPGDEAEVVTVVLTEQGGQTEMVFHQGGGHLDQAGYARAKAGWLVFFDELAATLAQGQR